ncbi:hypothetical protein BEWA_009140 [Theileria equi strain WA]|uniref:Uncharacterized protein n=1 Tax=Theileria equi strain WA TaxID=1537102 RepID=L0B0W9_THEEQ|nr:hypothetical protein BEWA_009140 [Theileria equi strain WA]AFZ81502.1 hypothetical protein BEWA_009140 [Theileria equi strain WA]|eukprot:XP_004831168.1 hypothetical protein BEWA_009140 [Theileria equi strain WA]
METNEQGTEIPNDSKIKHEKITDEHKINENTCNLRVKGVIKQNIQEKYSENEDGIFGRMDYYKKMYTTFEDRVNSMWNRGEFGSSTERLPGTRKSVHFYNDLDLESFRIPQKITVKSHRSMQVCHTERSTGAFREQNTVSKILRSGQKLYAFKFCNPGIKTPLYLDVGSLESMHCGLVYASREIGLFKVSIVPPPESFGSKVWNFLGLNDKKEGLISSMMGTFADYTGFSWSNETKVDERKTNLPFVQLRYMYTLDDELAIADNTLPTNCYIASFFNGHFEKLMCMQNMRNIKKEDIRGDHRFTLMLKPLHSDTKKCTIVNSSTNEQLCIDTLTNELKFGNSNAPGSYSYIVPACFKLVPLHTIVSAVEPNVKCETERRIRTPTVKRSARFVDNYGNFSPITAAAGTPAPSPRPENIMQNASGINSGSNDIPFEMPQRNLKEPNYTDAEKANIEEIYIGKTEKDVQNFDKSPISICSRTTLVPMKGNVETSRDVNVKNLKLRFERCAQN